MPLDIRLLVDQVTDLLEQLDRVSERHAAELAEIPEQRRRYAENLLHYAHLRTIDIRGLQNSLHDLGVTSLTTAESFTRGRLLLAVNVLRALAGEPSDVDVPAIIRDNAVSDELLDQNAIKLFGPERDDVPTRIMVTLPAEAADDYEMVLDFAKSGMDLGRINCAHDDPAVWRRMIANVRRAAEEVGFPIRVSMDLAGPKLRTGAIEDGPRVGRARVTRDETGKVLTPAKIWLTPREVNLGGPREEQRETEASPVAGVVEFMTGGQPPAGLRGRPALPLEVDRGWLEKLAIGSEITLHDTRSAKRHFTVVSISEHGVLAEGPQNAYIGEGTLLRCDYEVTRANGIPPTRHKLRFNVGDQLVLTTDPTETKLPAEAGDVPRIACSLPEAIEALRPGEPVLFDDGAIAAEVEELAPSPCGGFVDARLKVTRTKPGGQNLAEHKGINLPTTDLPFASLTNEDINHLRFVVENADIAAVSFIRTPEDVDFVLETLESIAVDHERAGRVELAEKARNLGLVMKIETIPAFENLPNIIMTAMKHPNSGLMIARGDLAVELGFDRMGEVPGQILTLAQSAGMPTILGTQVLETLAKAGLPSRAEITDAAFAIRAECIMLNKGPHITSAIGVLNHLSKAVGRSQRKSRIMLRRIRSWDQ